jgi:DNA-binding NtrC family response regulator
METLREFRKQAERMYLQRLLKTTSSRSEAARVAGVNRTHFYKLLRKHGIPCLKDAGTPKDERIRLIVGN